MTTTVTLGDFLSLVPSNHCVIECELWALAELPAFKPYFESDLAKKALWSVISHSSNPVPTNLISLSGSVLRLGVRSYAPILEGGTYVTKPAIVWNELIRLGSADDQLAFENELMKLPVGRSVALESLEIGLTLGGDCEFCYELECAREHLDRMISGPCNRGIYNYISLDLGVDHGYSAPDATADEIRAFEDCWRRIEAFRV